MKKIRNKATGEIVNFISLNIEDDVYELTVRLSENDKIFKFYYYSVEEFSKKWEDVLEEKPKVYYYITSCGEIAHRGYRLWGNESVYDKNRQEIGNFFETEEEAERAVEKLKAWKRLKDKQFKFYGWNKGNLLKNKPNNIEFACDDTRMWSWEDIQDDLDLLLGGEE